MHHHSSFMTKNFIIIVYVWLCAFNFLIVFFYILQVDFALLVFRYLESIEFSIVLNHLLHFQLGICCKSYGWNVSVEVHSSPPCNYCSWFCKCKIWSCMAMRWFNSTLHLQKMYDFFSKQSQCFDSSLILDFLCLWTLKE